MPTPVYRSGARGRVVGCILAFIDQVDRLAPNRSYASDGTIGDAAHQATSSKHNPTRVSWSSTPLIFAGDITHDPADGCDIGVLFEQVRIECAAGRERRIWLLIWNRRYCSPNTGWQWKAYTGSNPHTAHGHIEANTTSSIADSTAPFKIGGVSVADWTRNEIDQMLYEAKPWAGGALTEARKAAEGTARIESKLAALAAAVDALTKLINAGGGDVDTAAVIAEMQRIEQSDRARDEAHAAEIAELQAANNRLAAALAASGRALDAADG